ncbi:tagatose 1,6-diphosphate aldolase [Chloroflexota bacterium]
MEIALGKMRGLQQLADSRGIFAMCAMDHRGSLKRMLEESCPQATGDQALVDFKMDMCRVLAPHASAVLLDPIYGTGQAVTGGVLPGDKGLLVSLEATGYEAEGDEGGRITSLLPGWSVEKIKRMGASAVKLLLYYRPDLADIASKQTETAGQVAEHCQAEDIPFLLEPKSYGAGEAEHDPREYARIKPQLVIETARQLTGLAVDVLKAEFPAEMAYERDEARLLDLCYQLNEASRVPWVLLSGGVDFDTFSRQVEIACRAGASGFLAGRAVWQDAVFLAPGEERMRFLEDTVAPRLDRLTHIADTYGMPWFSRWGAARVSELEASNIGV